MNRYPQYIVMNEDINTRQEKRYLRINTHTYNRKKLYPIAIILHDDKKVLVDLFIIRGNEWKTHEPKDRWKFLPHNIAAKLLSESKAGYEVEIVNENIETYREINSWNDYIISKL